LKEEKRVDIPSLFSYSFFFRYSFRGGLLTSPLVTVVDLIEVFLELFRHFQDSSTLGISIYSK
jgi:hypothetical protein